MSLFVSIKDSDAYVKDLSVTVFLFYYFIFILYIFILYFLFFGYIINFQNKKSVTDGWKNSSHILGSPKPWVPTEQKTYTAWFSASDELLPHRKQRAFRE